MNVVIVTLSIVIVVCLILILLVATYNHFQDYIIRINEADENIDAVLRKRFDLLNKSIGIIKANIESEEEILEGIVKLRSKKLSNFELDRNLYDAINEFHTIKEKYPELQTNDEFVRIDINLMESESEIVGLRKYYNDIITDYNKLVKSCPSNFIAILKKYKTKDYFDGNNVDNEKGTIKL
ncbi:MAG: LemA family protein [Bacilli bacterium]|nr:LemA family protein [Bacilli bacterium]